MRTTTLILAFALLWTNATQAAQLLKVKPNKHAIVKQYPTGESAQITNLAAGTLVTKVDEIPLYYSIQLTNGQVGWAYKANFQVLPDTLPGTHAPVTKETLLARSDILQIVFIDVDVGDATLIICPQEGNQRDLILIDAGEADDRPRIEEVLKNAGFITSGKCLSRLIFTHYDADHIGSAAAFIPLAQIVYDRGNDKISKSYKKLVTQPGVDRRPITLDYHEDFSGGVTLRCVAVNGRTASTSTASLCSDENGRSIALILSFNGFDYFAGGDLTKTAEIPLAQSIPRCEVYHMDHHGSDDGSSSPAFLDALHPKVAIASNGTKHGHPTVGTCKYLTDTVHSVVFQTNINPDSRAYHPNSKFIADPSFASVKKESQEGPLGTIRLIVDPPAGNFYVLMPELTLAETTFTIDN